MNAEAESKTIALKSIRFSLGTFEGFNFRSQSAIPRILTADEVVGWDHDRQGEAEFWPAGDRAEMRVLFNHRSSITAVELLALDRLLNELSGDSAVNFLRIHYAVNIQGGDLADLNREGVENQGADVFLGSNFTDLRRDTAYELFELYYPEEYRMWEKSCCDDLDFDPDRFLDSPTWFVEEVHLGDQVALLVAPQ